MEPTRRSRSPRTGTAPRAAQGRKRPHPRRRLSTGEATHMPARGRARARTPQTRNALYTHTTLSTHARTLSPHTQRSPHTRTLSPHTTLSTHTTLSPHPSHAATHTHSRAATHTPRGGRDRPAHPHRTHAAPRRRVPSTPPPRKRHAPAASKRSKVHTPPQGPSTHHHNGPHTTTKVHTPPQGPSTRRALLRALQRLARTRRRRHENTPW